MASFPAVVKVASCVDSCGDCGRVKTCGFILTLAGTDMNWARLFYSFGVATTLCLGSCDSWGCSRNQSMRKEQAPQGQGSSQEGL